MLPLLSRRPLKVLRVAEGGFGRVYVVEDADGGRHACKTLKWELGPGREALAEEAGRLARLPSHPNLIDVMGVEWCDGDPYVCLPYCPVSLRNVMDRRRAGRPALNAALQIAAQIADGLEALHTAGDLLHLDLKPQNVLFESAAADRPLLTDFGLSRALPPVRPGGGRAVAAASAAGTVGYAAPEQLGGRPVTPAADVFALGAILYEMLVGRPPFVGGTSAEFYGRVSEGTVGFGLWERLSVPRRLRDLCLACLAHDPSHRPTATEAAAAIRNRSRKRVAPSKITSEMAPNIVNRAGTLASLGRLDEAEQLLGQVLNAHPQYASALGVLAEVKADRGDADGAALTTREALTAVRAFEAVNGEDAETKRMRQTFLTNLAYHFLLRDPASALPCAREACRLDPGDWQAHANLAEACRLLADARGGADLLAEGFSACEAGLRLRPGDRALNVTLGHLLLVSGDFARLCPHVRTLVNAHGGDDVQVRFLLIETLIAAGDPAEAERWLEPMRGHGPLGPMVRQLDGQIRACRRPGSAAA